MMTEPTTDFVEIPNWARLLNGQLSFGGPHPSRRDVLLVEAFVVSLGLILFVASFLVATDTVAGILRAGAAFELVCGYLVSWVVRIKDAYRLWPGSPGAAPERPQTWRSRIAT